MISLNALKEAPGGFGALKASAMEVFMNNAGDPEAYASTQKRRETSRRYYHRHGQRLNKEALEYAKVKQEAKEARRKQQVAALARLGLPPVTWTAAPPSTPSPPTFKVKGLTKREKKKVKKRYQQYRRELRREVRDAGGLEHVKQQIESSQALSVDVHEHIREPTAPKEMEQKTCVECKEPIGEEVAVQKCCMMFHRSCWEAARETYLGRGRYLKCVCRERRRVDAQGNIRRYGP